jgi:hypothetical protein
MVHFPQCLTLGRHGFVPHEGNENTTRDGCAVYLKLVLVNIDLTSALRLSTGIIAIGLS